MSRFTDSSVCMLLLTAFVVSVVLVVIVYGNVSVGFPL